MTLPFTTYDGRPETLPNQNEQVLFLAPLDDWKVGMRDLYDGEDPGYWYNAEGITFVEPGDKWISLDALAEFLNTLEVEE
jgi:hypothetical protein